MIRKPYDKDAFDWVKWNVKEMKKMAEGFLSTKKANYAKLKALDNKKRTFENTLVLLDHSAGEYEGAISKMSFLGEVSTKKEIRDAVSEIIVGLSQQMIDIEYDKGIYDAVLGYYNGAYKKEKKSLRPEDIRLLTETIREYKRMGFDLPKAKQNELKKLLKKTAALGEAFRKNINDYLDFIACTREELDGLSENYINALPKNEKGKFLVTLAYPHVLPFMAEAKNREKRKELGVKLLQKGGKKNLKIIHDLVALRAKIAAILGYKHHADFRTENRMAKSGATVEKFQNSILAKLAPLAREDLASLRAHAKTLGIKKLEHYDTSFVGTQLKKKLYDVDPEIVRSYFPLPHVLSTLFTLSETLFGITIKKTDRTLWHKDVTLYEVWGRKNFIGYFAMDLFPRQGKYSHAACFDVIIGHETKFKGNVYHPPFTSIVCNFPVPQKKVPSLLSVAEVETIYHEFGHCLHMTLSHARHMSQSGANVAWDFVETPSQIMENWVWNDAELKKLGKHWKTGEAIPTALRKKILAGKKFQNAFFYTRQIMQGKLDLDLHTGKVKDASKAWREMNKKYFSLDLPVKETLFPAGFGHLVGYDAGYYSYLWALVYACDAFYEFEKKGLRNKELGMRWRKEVLEKGGSEDEIKLIKAFLKRAPSQKAFLKEVIEK
jgi:thimet oligopeptidase